MPRVACLICLMLCASCGDQHDKMLHATAGALTAHVAGQITDDARAACAVALGVGVLKEAHDHARGRKFDPADAAATGLGCAIGWVF